MSNTFTIDTISKASEVRENNSNKAANPNFIQKTIVKFKAKRQAKKVISSLNEVKKIESGRKKAKSFDDFLKEL